MIHDTYELGQPKNAQSSGLAMPRSILRTFTCFFYTMFIMHQPTESLLFFFCFLRARDMKDIDISKNTKVAIIFGKKKKEKSRHSVCVRMRFKYDVEISDRNSQN